MLGLIAGCQSRGELLMAQKRIAARLEELDEASLKAAGVDAMRAELAVEIQKATPAQKEFISGIDANATFSGPLGCGKSWALGRAVLAWILEENHAGPPRNAFVLYQEASPFLGQTLDLAAKCGAVVRWESPWLIMPNGARITLYRCSPSQGGGTETMLASLRSVMQGHTHGFLAVENGVDEAFVELAQKRLRQPPGGGVPRMRRVVLTPGAKKCSGHYDDGVGSAPCTRTAGCGLQLCPSSDNVKAATAR